MGGRYSSPLSGKQRRYLRGCTAAMMKNFLPYYQRQLATAFLRQVSEELDLQGKLALQLLQSKTQRAPHVTLYDGLLSQYDEDSQRWKENYFVLLGDSTLEWFESKEALGKGCEPRGSTALSGYLLLTSLSEYTKLVSSLCQGFAGGCSQQGWNTLTDPPGEFLFFLYHPFRRHFCFCTNSAESQQIWKSALQDGIRYHSTELQRRGSFEAEAFLEAVRFYRQERGSYRTGDLLLGVEPEFLQEAYTLILSQVSSEFKVFQREKEKLQIQLEKKIRPDLDQMLTLKDQIARKLQATVQSPAESCCCQGVEPDLDCVMEELMRPISSGAEMVRSLFAQRVDEMVRTVRNSPIAVLQKELLTLGRTSWMPEIMQPCYEKADVYKESLQGLERFGFHSVTSLVLGAQNLMQQLMQNSIYTFQQLSEQRLSQATNRNQVIQMLENVKDRVLKKFDYDSSSTRKQFAQEWLVQIFLPFLLKHLESRCKLELPKYESYVFADFSGIINVENIYEEMVLAVLLKAISKALKEASGRNKHNLYSDSFFCVLESVDNLLHEATARELSEIRMGALSSNSALDTVNFPTCQVNKSASGEKIW
ncbi:protein Niban 3 isoform X2 [Dromaius novaehollandiae]|uniref:Niban apoptosis regulator 3 n=1 Tax=Dromaius novaehollandiae TaxID=8790 RepID=A0A8C4J2M9_DRONO|nr:niban-like protein 2 isoform X2 [Dromaius novaehollandiae]